LSEHNIEWLKTQSAQVQMEFLRGAAINHDQGATDMIAKMLKEWHGKLHRSQRWQDLETTALSSNDLRVRAAASKELPQAEPGLYAAWGSMGISS